MVWKMEIDLNLVSEILKIAGTGIVTLIVARVVERRPRLVAYYGHVAAHSVEGDPPFDVGAHSVIVRNLGRLPAHNVKIAHGTLPPNVTMYPRVEYLREPVPGSGDNIVFPVLAPGQQVTISYLYTAPLMYSQVTGEIRCDEGMAKILTVLLTRQFRPWQNAFFAYLMLAGLLATVYGAITLALALVQLFG